MCRLRLQTPMENLKLQGCHCHFGAQAACSSRASSKVHSPVTQWKWSFLCENSVLCDNINFIDILEFGSPEECFICKACYPKPHSKIKNLRFYQNQSYIYKSHTPLLRAGPLNLKENMHRLRRYPSHALNTCNNYSNRMATKKLC